MEAMEFDQHDLERRRRSLVMANRDKPASALTNGEAVILIADLQRHDAFRRAVLDIIQTTAPHAARENALLRRVLRDLAHAIRDLEA